MFLRGCQAQAAHGAAPLEAFRARLDEAAEAAEDETRRLAKASAHVDALAATAARLLAAEAHAHDPAAAEVGCCFCFFCARDRDLRARATYHHRAAEQAATAAAVAEKQAATAAYNALRMDAARLQAARAALLADPMAPAAAAGAALDAADVQVRVFFVIESGPARCVLLCR